MKKRTFAKETMIQTTFVACILLFTSCGYNQKPEDTKVIAEEQNYAKFDNSMQEKDAQFLVNAAEINLGQIQLGQLAQQNGTTNHVKELGKVMEDSYTKLLNDLTVLAKDKTVTIPTSPTDNSNNAHGRLNEKSGNDFDKAYTDMMVSVHEDAIAAFEEASAACNDADIQNWAKATLPDLRRHLERSVSCQKKYDKM